ncbi:MAG: hypothetical protein JWM95_2126 [Gemmatimonadetes bacterium]|nr:hypothetical protein [Gemmatimonadota bacterium]
MRGVGREWNGWTLSFHGAAFAQYDKQLTKRGDEQSGVIDWEMMMAMRPVAGGALQLNVMTSLEPFLLGGNGYPELLQTGGTFAHSFMHDRQHPHDALMELAATYAHDIGAVTGSIYVAAAGEPALGPVAYMHRPSAANDPFAPLGHHWQDAAHQSFGVVTLGVNTHAIKIEGSVFNPREPDEHHLIADYRGARLDSYTGRLSWAPTAHVVASSWWAYLNSHDRLDPDTRMHRYGAAVTTQDGAWSNTLAWGMNLHHHSGSSHELIHGAPGASPHHHASSLLLESNRDLDRGAVFARVERVMKDGEELGFQGGDLTELYDVRSVSAGFTRDVASLLALGARGSVNFIPATLLATYGTRTPAGFAVYAHVRAGHR